MGSLDDAFAELSSLCVEQFAQGENVTIRRVAASVINPATQSRTETNTDVSVKAIRSLNTKVAAMGGNFRGNLTMEEHSYQVKTADLVYQGTAFVPKEGDRVIDPNGPGGASAEYFVTRVTNEVNGTMTRLMVRSTPVRA